MDLVALLRIIDCLFNHSEGYFTSSGKVQAAAFQSPIERRVNSHRLEKLSSFFSRMQSAGPLPNIVNNVSPKRRRSIGIDRRRIRRRRTCSYFRPCNKNSKNHSSLQWSNIFVRAEVVLCVCFFSPTSARRQGRNVTAKKNGLNASRVGVKTGHEAAAVLAVGEASF